MEPIETAEFIELLEYLKENPREVKRFDQCFNCEKLNKCKEDCKEDENGMCLEHMPLNR